MKNWLIYEPPGGAAPTLAGAESFVTVREGFSKFAFLAPLIWLVWRRSWVALGVYAAVEVALSLVGRQLDVRPVAMTVVALLPNLAVGFEAAWLRSRALERRGYRLVGALVARDREQAEALFFHEWLAGRPSTRSEPPPGGPRAPYRPAGQPGVLGLFPQAGAAR